MALTDAKLKSLSGTTRDREQTLTDRDGLSVRLSKSGVITFQHRYKYKGKPARYAIGNYPAIPLKKAREAVQDNKGLLAVGIDPRQQRRLDLHKNQQAKTVRSALEYWLEHYAKHKRSDHDKLNSMFNRYVYGAAGDLEIDKTETVHWLPIFDEMADVQAQSGRLLGVLKQAVDYCNNRGYCNCLALHSLKLKDVGRPIGKKERYLYDHELKSVYGHISGPDCRLQARNRAVMHLLLGFGCRTVEIRKAKKRKGRKGGGDNYFDLENGIWTVEKSKSGHTIRRPIPERLRPHIELLIALYPHSDYLVPVETGRKKTEADRPVSGQSLVNMAKVVTRAAGVADFGNHDLRRTITTHLGVLGIAPHIPEKMLGHKMSGVMAIYNKHDYLKEQLHAYNIWLDHLDLLIKKPDNVHILKTA